jgi:hypothetical protein
MVDGEWMFWRRRGYRQFTVTQAGIVAYLQAWRHPLTLEDYLAQAIIQSPEREATAFMKLVKRGVLVWSETGYVVSPAVLRTFD